MFAIISDIPLRYGNAMIFELTYYVRSLVFVVFFNFLLSDAS